MTTIKLKVTSADKKIEEEISLCFTANEISLLQRYLSNCERLQCGRLIQNGLPSITNISFTSENGFSIEFTEFQYNHVYELLHLARPIFLSKEPASFEKTIAVFGKKSKGTALAKHLKYIRQVYIRGDYQPYFQVSVNDTPLFHEELLKDWLNGIEYHQDEDKAERVKALEKSLTEDVARKVFVSQLSGRIRAISMLAHLVQPVVNP